jgi:predicted amidohydrolase
MLLCVAQLQSFKGDIERNIQKHVTAIQRAAAHHSDIIIFPELSLTGYEPSLAGDLATAATDTRLDVLQQFSVRHTIVTGAGLPLKTETGIQIAMILFQPDGTRVTYSKQYLHDDELPYFVKGERQVTLTLHGHRIAPAICYESLLPEHAERAFREGTVIYMASVAKSAYGVAKAHKHYSNLARQYCTTVMMANAIGPNDNFESAGYSAVWNKYGEMAGQLESHREGILVYDNDSGECYSYYL